MASPMMLVQQSPEEKRRMELSQAMMGNALQYRPMRTGWEALGSIASAYAGKKLGEQAEADYAQRREQGRDTLSRAMAARESAPAPYAPGQEQAAFRNIMGETPETSDLMMQMELNRINAEQTAAGKEPKLLKGYDPNSPTQVSYFNPADPGTPIMPAPAGSKGLNIGFNDGQLSDISFGGTGIGPAGEVSAPTSRTIGTVQDKSFNTNEGYERMYRISQLYRPEYQQVVTRFNMWGAELKDKFGGLDENNKRELYDYSRFRKTSVNHLNQYFNEISGAAVSPDEAVRLTNGLPNPGTGIWDGDGPTVFEAGLDEAMRGARMSNLRYNVWMKIGDKGGNPWDIPFSDVGDWLRNMGGDGKSTLNTYAAEVERQLLPRYQDPIKLREAVKRTIKQDLNFSL